MEVYCQGDNLDLTNDSALRLFERLTASQPAVTGGDGSEISVSEFLQSIIDSDSKKDCSIGDYSFTVDPRDAVTLKSHLSSDPDAMELLRLQIQDLSKTLNKVLAIVRTL